MFKALAACPDAEVLRPDMAKYSEVGRAIREEMLRLTPLVEPVSIDEAFLDLSGTEKLHGERELAARYGRIGARMARLARGKVERDVNARAPAHSISAETTLPHDEADVATLAHALWPLCERVSARLKQASLAGRTITLKLKTADFRLPTRSRRLADPTQLAEALFRRPHTDIAAQQRELTGAAAEKVVSSSV
jgi:nucleotidyltransferase/DNA polymerase involved in DNA repair